VQTLSAVHFPYLLQLFNNEQLYTLVKQEEPDHPLLHVQKLSAEQTPY
jgi:hypothetical protein